MNAFLVMASEETLIITQISNTLIKVFKEIKISYGNESSSFQSILFFIFTWTDVKSLPFSLFNNQERSTCHLSRA